jgi:phosphate transport system substrate-binding protein
MRIVLQVLAVACISAATPRALAAPKKAAPKSGPLSLSGAGASFPLPLYTKWIAEYGKANAKVTISYDPAGSGAGVERITARSVDFGASDLAMTDELLAKAPAKIVHLPTALGAVVITYHVSGGPLLKLTPEILAGIYLGEITRWDDPQIASVNPRVKLPEEAIRVAYRSDSSGTTAVFTEYLSKVSDAWKQKVGTGKTVNWPTGTGAKGNDGVSSQVKDIPGGIGYVEMAYAVQNLLPQAILRNKAGKFVWPKIETMTAAAAATASAMPDDMRVSITDAPGDDAYPIAAYTYLLVYEDMPDRAKGEALANFLWWAEHEGQVFCTPLWYGPLPKEVVTRVETKLKGLRSKGQPLLSGK